MHQFIILWIISCLILHNFVICIEEKNEAYDIYEWYHPENCDDGNGGDGREDNGNDEGWENFDGDSKLFHSMLMGKLLNTLV
jgi:hypothetical protein